jgi:hypothetical protein
VDVVVDGQDPAHLLIERWASREADAAYRAFRAGAGAGLQPHLSVAPSLTKGELDPSV